MNGNYTLGLRGMAVTAAAAENVVRKDVIVIGAGAAGMTAAYDLKRDGYDVAILEASGKIGGRLQKDESLASFPIDLGGEWLQVSANFVPTLIAFGRASRTFKAPY